MVEAVRQGLPLREAARRFRVHLRTVEGWVRRAGRRRMDRVDWADRPPLARTIHRTAAALEERIVALRRDLAERSPLGECGALAIHA